MFRFFPTHEISSIPRVHSTLVSGYRNTIENSGKIKNLLSFFLCKCKKLTISGKLT